MINNSKNLCQLCLENELPFKAKKKHWKNAYVVVTGFSNEIISAGENKYFKVFGEVYGSFTRYDKNFDGSIKNSGVYDWEVIL